MANALRSLPVTVRTYHAVSSEAAHSKYPIADFRSDVLTKPDTGMLKYMFDNATYNDDVFEEDSMTKKLENKVANLLGHESGLFVSSGTMGNLLSLMAHCYERSCEIIVGDKSHIHLYEQGGVAGVGGIHCRVAKTNDNGTLNMNEIFGLYRHEYPDTHFPKTKVICLENTHNKCGGRIVSIEHFKEVSLFCKQYNLALHLDGARLLNASVKLGIQPSEYTKYVDSVTICFSKGLGAPIGSCLAGSYDFIARCRRFRKLLGGATRQPGILAAAAYYALENASATIKADHTAADKLYEGLAKVSLPDWLRLEKPDTNIFCIVVNPKKMSASEFVALLEKPTDDSPFSVRTLPMAADIVRVICYNQITQEHLDMFVNKLKYVLSKY